MKPGLTRRRFDALVGCALAGAAWPLSAQEPAPYEVFEFDWHDTARHRAVPVRLYWPHTVSQQARVPLVVFSHGIGGSRRGYSYLGQHWSANGVASLHLQHVGSDRQVWFGNPLGMLSRLQDAAQEHEAIARAQDLHFALDQLLGARSEFAPRIDGARIVVAGHSYGANTALLAAGARVERGGRAIDLREPRARAAIVLSAPPFYGEGDPSRILAPVTVPTLHVTATGDVIRIPGYYSDAEDRVAVFEATGSIKKALAVFEGGSHSMFTDRAGTGGVELNPQVKAATKELSLAFVRNVFSRDGADALALWAGRHRAILARFVGLTGASSQDGKSPAAVGGLTAIST
jgi:pimeloyl-ACP methyl ester carboxylesterase